MPSSFGHQTYIVVISVSQRMKSLRSNFFYRRLVRSIKLLIISQDQILRPRVLLWTISCCVLFSAQAFAQGIEVKDDLLIKCCQRYPIGLAKDGEALHPGLRAVTYPAGTLEKCHYGEREWSIIGSADLPFQFVSFAKKNKKVHFYSGSIPGSHLSTDSLRCVGRLTIPNVTQLEKIEYNHGKDQWKPNYVQQNGAYYEKVEKEVRYLLIQNQIGDYFVTPEQEVDWILERTERALEWEKNLPNELIFKEESTVEENIHSFRITRRGFIFADSDSSSKAELIVSNENKVILEYFGRREWNFELVKANISCNYNSQTKRFEFPVQVIGDYYLLILNDKIPIDSVLKILHPEAFEWQTNHTLRLAPKNVCPL